MKRNKIDEEMKKENEEILNRWREIGLLDGLKEGSQNEWRVAKSFELMTQYLLKNNKDTLQISSDDFFLLEHLSFPIIRRLICGNHPKVNRIIQPEEIIDPLINKTISEIIECVEGTIKKKTISYTKRFAEYYHIEKMPLITTLALLDYKCDLKMLQEVFNVDIEVLMVVIFSKYLTIKLADKKV